MVLPGKAGTMRQFLGRLALLAIIILVVFGMYRLLTIQPLDPAPFFLDVDETPLIVANVGQQRDAPPYTRAAFQAALAAGADGLLLPLYRSRDGALVVSASPDVASFSDGEGMVLEYTLEELQALDAGYRFDPSGDGSYPLRGQGQQVTTLDEALGAFPDLLLVAELGNPDLPGLASLLQAIDASDARDRVLVVLDDQQLIDTLRQQAPGLATAYTSGETNAFLTTYRLRLTPFYRPAAEALLLDAAEVTPAMVRAAHGRGVGTLAVVGSDALPSVRQDLVEADVDAVVLPADRIELSP